MEKNYYKYAMKKFIYEILPAYAFYGVSRLPLIGSPQMRKTSELIFGVMNKIDAMQSSLDTFFLGDWHY